MKKKPISGGGLPKPKPKNKKNSIENIDVNEAEEIVSDSTDKDEEE